MILACTCDQLVYFRKDAVPVDNQPTADDIQFNYWSFTTHTLAIYARKTIPILNSLKTLRHWCELHCCVHPTAPLEPQFNFEKVPLLNLNIGSVMFNKLFVPLNYYYYFQFNSSISIVINKNPCHSGFRLSAQG